jgi:effector-binding domain-containing protein
MPYETEAVEKLHQWILENDYEITGDILDVCLLDTTFYQSDKNVDFCILEIPIKK